MACPDDIFAARARYVIKEHHKQYKNVLDEEMPGPIIHHLPEVPEVTDALPVCIIGAGAAGLYTALIFDSLGIPYTILEANPNLFGGRMFTKYFYSTAKPNYDYYDVGAMRFPNTPFMKRTFDLVDPNRQPPILNPPPPMIPYIFQMTEPNTFLYYNGNQTANVPGPNLPANPFKISPKYVPQNLLQAGEPANSIKNVLADPRQLFVDNKIGPALEKLYQQYDQYSMRSWMEYKGYSSSGINYCETLDKSSGWYDRALTETVLESLAFDWPGGGEISWKCFDLGTYQLPLSMHNALKTKAQLGYAVKKIDETNTGMNVSVSINGQPPVVQSYAAVISTVTLSCLSVMDLTGCHIAGGDNYSQWAAIRELQYGPAIKIGLRFTAPWWEALRIVGGQSYTDLPIRTTVYPSYPPTGSKSPVLIVSYCWTQDAERLSALINRDGTVDPDLIDIVLRDLALVHGVDVGFIQRFFPNTDSNNCFAWSWGQNKYTMGAYAFFGPQQFADSNPQTPDSLYGNITLPAASNKLYISGEATSSCHAWVAGAFDSSWRAVQQFLTAFSGQYGPDVMKKFLDIWGPSEYWDQETTETHMKLALHLAKGKN